MYCPQCKSEYREGFDTCAECQIPLVEGEAPEEVEEGDYDAEEGLQILLQTTHPTSLEAIILRLEEQGIPYVVQSGTALSLLHGILDETLPEDWKAMVLVPAENVEAAMDVVRQAGATTEETQAQEPAEE